MNSLKTYLKELEKGLRDKLFFTSLIDLSKFDYVVDFGCANGKIIEQLYQSFPNTIFINYDVSPNMIAQINYNAPNVLNTFMMENIDNAQGKKAFIICED